MHQSFAETQHWVLAKTKLLVEIDDIPIVIANLQIDLRTPKRSKTSLRFRHEYSTVSLSLAIRINSKVINPPAMSFESNHDRTHNSGVDTTNQKKLWLYAPFAGNVFVGIIPRFQQPAALP